MEALRRQDPGAARSLLERAVTADPGDAEAWYGLALARRGLGDELGEMAALDRVLTINADHLPALMMKADYFARVGDGRAAHAFYRAVATRTGDVALLPADLKSEVRRAERESARFADSYETHLLTSLAHAGFDPKTSSRRFSHGLDLLLGKRRLFQQAPTAFFYPELPHRQFYERAEFPWLVALEAETPIIRQELLDVLGEGDAFSPYVRTDPNRPRTAYGALLDNSDWSAYYLIRYGQVVAAARERCPRTFEALRTVPLTDAPGRTPAVLFSLLHPGVRIPPHNGYTNARLICHLPLIVPGEGGLRVGNETRHWIQGETLIFDDSIEHEAWNASGEVRVVLLFDIWRPELSVEERRLVAATLAAVGTYGGAVANWD